MHTRLLFGLLLAAVLTLSSCNRNENHSSADDSGSSTSSMSAPPASAPAAGSKEVSESDKADDSGKAENSAVHEAAPASAPERNKAPAHETLRKAKNPEEPVEKAAPSGDDMERMD
jgi:cytoskeletal protein RodZ